MSSLVAEAADRGARLVLLPEKWNAIADGRELLAHAESLEQGGSTLDALSGWAQQHEIDLICGSIAIADGDRVGNVSIAFGPDGSRVATYTKIHLFDVDVGGISYRESEGTAPGSGLTVARLSGLPVGLSVCYDLRFPELYRALEQAGALILTVPAAFTLLTGMAHWEPLLRARAIENQAFVLAADQHGDPGDYGIPRFGHSMIIDPWGTVIARAGPTGEADPTHDTDFHVGIGGPPGTVDTLATDLAGIRRHPRFVGFGFARHRYAHSSASYQPDANLQTISEAAERG